MRLGFGRNTIGAAVAAASATGFGTGRRIIGLTTCLRALAAASDARSARSSPKNAMSASNTLSSAKKITQMISGTASAHELDPAITTATPMATAANVKVPTSTSSDRRDSSSSRAIFALGLGAAGCRRFSCKTDPIGSSPGRYCLIAGTASDSAAGWHRLNLPRIASSV